eukprot:gb/GECG01010834.1/.p1 GENE.gb/GECG01010834.1/~~gb/GECG01010834.1/.p1  ORF type:complete len:767 (+),score=72.34 gb/GECG01010834.1/:1-2301(+)
MKARRQSSSVRTSLEGLKMAMEEASSTSSWGKMEVRYEHPHQKALKRNKAEFDKHKKEVQTQRKRLRKRQNTPTGNSRSSSEDENGARSTKQTPEKGHAPENRTPQSCDVENLTGVKVGKILEKFPRQHEAFKRYDELCFKFWSSCIIKQYQQKITIPGLHIPPLEDQCQNGGTPQLEAFIKQISTSARETMESWLPRVRLPIPPYKIMSEELSTSGRRNFSVGTTDELWRLFQKPHPTPNHIYEIVREDTPVHLYFDVEFPRDPSTGMNMDLNEEELLDSFIARVRSHLSTLFGILFDRSHVLDLDSSTVKKFSRHLIVRLSSSSKFRDHQHAGEFLLTLVADIISEDKKDDCGFWVTDDEGISTLLTDVGVYTRNRAMRTYLSCKLGKTHPLYPAEANQFNPLPQSMVTVCTVDRMTGKIVSDDSCRFQDIQRIQVGDTEWERRIWLNSLITDTLPPLHLVLQYFDRMFQIGAVPVSAGTGGPSAEKRLATEDFETFHPSCHPCGGALLYMFPPKSGRFTQTPSLVSTWQPPSLFARLFDDSSRNIRTGIAGRYKRLVYGENSKENVSSHPESSEYQEIWVNPSGSSSSKTEDVHLQRACTYIGTVVGHSVDNFPFPSLAEYIKLLASKGNKQAFVRKWEGCLMEARFKPIHQGSGSPLRILRKEVYTKFMFHIIGNRWCERIGRFHKSNHVAYVVDMLRGTTYQTCFDPDCAGFRSRTFTIPRQCLPDQSPENMTLDTDSADRDEVVDPSLLTDQQLKELNIP